MKKWGVQEGVKMMVTSSLLSNNFGIQSSQKIVNNKNCSKQSSFGASGLAGTVSAIAAMSSMPVAKTMLTGSQRHVKSVTLEKRSEPSDNSVETPKQKQFPELIRTPTSTPVSDSTSDSSATQQCEETWPVDTGFGKSQPLLPTPSVERLLPIGVQKGTNCSV